MVNMEDGDYLHTLSRPELQKLCRENGLPANKTKPHLVQLLASRFQRKNVSSVALGERSSGLIDDSPFTTSVLNFDSELNPVGETNKGVHDIRTEAADGDKKRSPTISKEIPSECADPSTNGNAEVYGCSTLDIEKTRSTSLQNFQCYNIKPAWKDKDNSEYIEAIECNQSLMNPARSTGLDSIAPVQCGNRNPCNISITSSFISSNGDETELVPSFEFHVKSEEGINLFVDLNSNPLEWIREMNDGVFIHELRSLRGGHEEANNSSFDNTVTDYKTKDDLTFTESSLDSVFRDGNHMKADQPDKAYRSLPPTSVMQSNASVEIFGLVNEIDQLNSSLCEPNFDVQNQMNMCIPSAFQGSGKITLPLEVPLTSQLKSDGNHAPGSNSVGSKSGDLVEDKSKNGNNSWENIETCSLGTSSVSRVRWPPVSSEILEIVKPIPSIHGSGSGDLEEMPLSEVPSLSSWENIETCSLGTSSVSRVRLPPVSSEILEIVKPIPGIHGSGSGDLMEMPLSEVPSLSEDIPNLPYQNGGEPDPDCTIHNLQNEISGAAQSELDPNESLDRLSESPNKQLQQRSSLTNETEISECSQFDMNAKDCKRSNSSDSEELGDKRQHRNAEDSSNSATRSNSSDSEGPGNKRQRSNVEDSSNTAIKNLRRSKKLARKVLPRRSMRLVPK